MTRYTVAGVVSGRSLVAQWMRDELRVESSVEVLGGLIFGPVAMSASDLHFDPVQGGIRSFTEIFDPHSLGTGVVLAGLDKVHEGDNRLI
jgi:hypothetical protein